MQNPNYLQVQIESLKEILSDYERTNADQITRKWRAKVYEELVRNKQQQLEHSIELKKIREEEKRHRTREQELRSSLEAASYQVSNLSNERQKLLVEIQNLTKKSKSIKQFFNSSMLMNLQNNMNGQSDTLTRILALLETYHHRLAFCLSRLKTAKMLNTREVKGLKNKVYEEKYENKRLREENSYFRSVQKEVSEKEKENQNLRSEVEKLKSELESTGSKTKQELGSMHKEYKELLNSVKTENSNLKCEIESLKENILSVEKEAQLQVEQKEQEIKQLKQQTKTLHSEVEETKSKLACELSEHQKQTNLELEAKDKTIKELTEKLSVLQEKNTAVEKREDEQTKQLSMKDEKIRSLKEKLRKLKEEFSKYKYKNEDEVLKLKNEHQQRLKLVDEEKQNQTGETLQLQEKLKAKRQKIADLKNQVLVQREANVAQETKEVQTYLEEPSEKLPSKLDELEALSKELLSDF